MLLKDREELARARLMLLTCLANLAFCIPLVGFAHFQRPEFMVANSVVLAGHMLLMATFMLLRFFPSTAVPVTALTVVASVEMISATFWSGGIHSVVLFMYPIAPLFFGLLGRLMHGVVNALCLLAGLSVMYVMELKGIAPLGPSAPTMELDMLTLGWSVLTGLAMATYARRINTRVTERLVAELQQRTEAEREAQAARQTKDWFIAYLSHEMRSPLTVISGGVDLIEHTQDDVVRERQMGALRSATTSMVHLMDDVLDISAIERGELKLTTKSVVLTALLELLQAEYAPIAQARGLSLDFDCPEGVMVRCDIQRTRQVLSNLLDNALKFTLSGGVSVSVEHQEAVCCILVSDTGPGIEEADQGRIFEPFSRLEGGSIRGTGLGLAISSMLVERMGSTLQVESVLGEGSSFCFELPFVEG
jgi:signal transduction histidine kinase